MANNVARCIEFCSSIHALEPGDILATGTNHRGLHAFQDGDRIELEIEGLGRLRVERARRPQAHAGRATRGLSGSRKAARAAYAPQTDRPLRAGGHRAAAGKRFAVRASRHRDRGT